jgi:hypothetical protein
MPDSNLDQIKLKEYQQRRKVESLRRQLYEKSDPSLSTDLADALTSAENDLKELERQRQAAEKTSEAVPRGVLLSTDKAESAKPGGIMLGPETTGIDAKVLLRMSHVPSGVAHLLNVKETPLVSYEIKNTGDDWVRLRLVAFVEGFSARSVDTVEIAAGKSASLAQLPTFFPDKLAHVTEMTRATLNIQIDDLDGKTEQQSTFPIWLMARTSAFNSIYDPANYEWKDISYYYGAWITPNAPEIMNLLRRAADKHPQKSLAGYQVNEAGVREQVKAIYDTLREEKILYIHSVVSFGASEEQAMQRVRLPRESLATKSANCIDGTVLMASVLEAASINPGIVLVPGHAFLAWQTKPDDREWDFVETTMLSTHNFEEARKEGVRQANKQQAAFAQSGNTDDYLLWSLAELRAVRGIYPME